MPSETPVEEQKRDTESPKGGIELRYRAIRFCDTAVIVVALVMFYLTIGFIHSMNNAGNTIPLLLGWIGLFTAIVLSLVSELRIAMNWRQHGNPLVPHEVEPRFTINTVAIIALAIGTLFMLIFVYGVGPPFQKLHITQSGDYGF
jgi:hypothetical protein